MHRNQVTMNLDFALDLLSASVNSRVTAGVGDTSHGRTVLGWVILPVLLVVLVSGFDT